MELLDYLFQNWKKMICRGSITNHIRVIMLNKGIIMFYCIMMISSFFIILNNTNAGWKHLWSLSRGLILAFLSHNQTGYLMNDNPLGKFTFLHLM